MARIIEPSAEQIATYAAWLEARPPAVRAVAERIDPWSLYRMKSTRHRVILQSFQEPHKDGDPITVTVLVSAHFNLVAFERSVFGVAPEDLEPCELPGPNEPVGAMLTHEEFDEHIDAIRAAICAAETGIVPNGTVH